MSFEELKLSKPVMQALHEVGYEKPSPIQAQTIPLLLAGKNVLGQAQTGTGKTAAFALPALSNINADQHHTQVLVLTPTRELAIQVAAAFQRYGAHIRGLHVLSIYGGQDYRVQLRALSKGVHIVVGTPGRVMDHMRRKTLDLAKLNTLVLDEADEMLRMGFIDDVEWVLEQTPKTCQMALFSATMPKEIRVIAERYLQSPEKITIKEKTATVAAIRQRYMMIKGSHKLDALARILEAEKFDGVIVFVRTKTATLEVAEALNARGYACAALNGDIQQINRERTIAQLKKGVLDIIVATDVAARGLDVDRISHVINYDIPHDNESYIHRIGRTGRAGRSGEAILFVSPRERGLLYSIEKTTNQPITQMDLPSAELINNKRIANFKQQITETLAEKDLDVFSKLIKDYQEEHQVSEIEISAALVKLIHKQTPLFVKNEPIATKSKHFERESSFAPPPRTRGRGRESSSDADLTRYRIEVGHKHGVRPGNIVGAIANEINLDSQDIGHISINDLYSTVDLPKSLTKEALRILEKVWIAGKQLQITIDTAPAGSRERSSGDRGERSRSRSSAGGERERSRSGGGERERSRSSGGERERSRSSAGGGERERSRSSTGEKERRDVSKDRVKIIDKDKKKTTYAPKAKKKRQVAVCD